MLTLSCLNYITDNFFKIAFFQYTFDQLRLQIIEQKSVHI